MQQKLLAFIAAIPTIESMLHCNIPGQAGQGSESATPHHPEISQC
jgi:hypothetical protein